MQHENFERGGTPISVPELLNQETANALTGWGILFASAFVALGSSIIVLLLSWSFWLALASYSFVGSATFFALTYIIDRFYVP